MIHLYKSGGAWRTKEGVEYTIKSVNESVVKSMLADGWSMSLSEIGAPALTNDTIPEEGSDYEAQIRAEIFDLSGKRPGGRSSIATLEAQLKKLKGE